MKKDILIFVLILLHIACKQDNKDSATFSGQILNTNETFIKILDYNHSYEKKIAIDKSGNFKDTIRVSKPGAYFFQIGRNYNTVFLKNGYDLHMTVDVNDFYNSIRFSGKGSKINNFNISRLHLKAKLIGNSKDFFLVPLDSFLVRTEANKKAFLELLNNSELSKEEKAIESKIIKYDFILTRNNYDKFVYYHTKKHPDLPEDYYDPVKYFNIDDEEAYCYSKCYRTLLGEKMRLLYNDTLKKNPYISIIDFTKDKVKNIHSVLIKDRIISVMLFRQINAKNKNLDSDYKEILQLLNSKILKDKLTKKYNSLKSTKPKMEAIDFNYENYNGGKTSLKDLRGKIVYIDVWASWCGPCKKEMPALAKLIKKYKGTDIEFVSISVDSKNNYDKWRKIVADENLGGIQLFSDNSFKSEFMKFYNVSLIPRYILIDKNGKIISSQAPRPSDKKTTQLLDSLLANMK
jgi:thiol-disulfide isomerase/thioredoxin